MTDMHHYQVNDETALNPCAAKTVYICFQATCNFTLNKIPLKSVTYLVVDAKLIK